MAGLFGRTSKILSAVPSTASAAPLALPAGVLSEPVELIRAIFPDVDDSNFPVTVGEAMAVPAVKRALLLYSSLAARFPLLATEGGEWLTKTIGPVTPQMRQAYTVQDLIFHNMSLWQVTSRDESGEITDAEHVGRNRWRIEKDGVLVDDQAVNQSDLIWFGGLTQGAGFLHDGRHSVRQYTNIARTINNRAAVAEPVTLVREIEDSKATKEEIDQAMDDLEESLTSARGGMVFVPFGISIDGFGGSDNANTMMTAARNAARLDIANHLGIKAELLEGASDGSSDTYNNALMVQSELLELSIKAYTEPIANRLSQDDVTPEGVVVTFDYSSYDTTPETGTVPAPTLTEAPA